MVADGHIENGQINTMNWEAIGAIGEILGAVAVLVTLVYLASQIRQNSQQIERSATQAINSAMSQTNLFTVDSSDIADVNLRGFADLESLSEDEQIQFHTFWMTNFMAYQDGYLEFLAGRLPADTWRPVEVHIFRWLESPGMASWWDRERNTFGAAFARYVDAGAIVTRGVEDEA